MVRPVFVVSSCVWLIDTLIIFIRLYHTDRSLFQHTHFDGMKLLPTDLCLRKWILAGHHKVNIMKIIMVSLIVNMLFC